MKGQVLHSSAGSKGELRIIGAVPSNVKLTGAAARVVRQQARARRALDRAVAEARRR